MGDLGPWPVIEPVSLHWEHGVLATALPGKSPSQLPSQLWILGLISLHNHVSQFLIINLSLSHLPVSLFTKKRVDKNCIQPIDQFQEHWHLYYVESSQSVNLVCLFSYFRSSLMYFISILYISGYRFCIYFVKLIPKYFILWSKWYCAFEFLLLCAHW